MGDPEIGWEYKAVTSRSIAIPAAPRWVMMCAWVVLITGDLIIMHRPS